MEGPGRGAGSRRRAHRKRESQGPGTRDFACVLDCAPKGAWLVAYRVAHAQKSLSLVLKHLWCHQKLPQGTEPPGCPIDRIILDRAKRGHGITWTTISTMEGYRSALGLVKAAANASRLSVATYELFVYSGRPASMDSKMVDSAQRWFLDSDPLGCLARCNRSRDLVGCARRRTQVSSCSSARICENGIGECEGAVQAAASIGAEANGRCLCERSCASGSRTL
jgi:hypothetical protein